MINTTYKVFTKHASLTDLLYARLIFNHPAHSSNFIKKFPTFREKLPSFMIKPKI